MSKVSRIGIDLSKSVFVVYGVDEREQCCRKCTFKRAEILPFFATLEPCQVAMESGSGAHYWARELITLGHNARIIDPKLVAPYRHQGRSGKNDTNDAEAICEAMSRPKMCFVPVKDQEQQAALVVHRVRKGIVNELNRVANRLRGLLAEFGGVIPKGLRTLHRDWPEIRQHKSDQVPDAAWAEFDALYARSGEMHQQLLTDDRKTKAHLRQDRRAARIAEISGVGATTASAVVATIGNGHDFRNGRQFAARLGLTPRQSSSGGKTALGRITKRGDRYLRTLLVHGARSELKYVHRRSDAKSRWAHKLREEKSRNKATVALANKHARMIRTILARENAID